MSNGSIPNPRLSEILAARDRWPSLLARLLLLTLLWWLLNNGDTASWVLGVPTILLATLVSAMVLPRTRWRIKPLPFLRFTAYFLVKSFLSSIDVASRVLRPQMPLKPALITYPIRLRGQLPPVIMANATSLLPGTLSVELKEGELHVHVLDERDPVLAELSRLEEYVAAVYGLDLGEETG
jgi:multicomponent Na+:H+ antiporter subunit E